MDSPEEERNKTEDRTTGVHRDIQEANGIGVEYMLGKCKHNEISSHCAAPIRIYLVLSVVYSICSPSSGAADNVASLPWIIHYLYFSTFGDSFEK